MKEKLTSLDPVDYIAIAGIVVLAIPIAIGLWHALF